MSQQKFRYNNFDLLRLVAAMQVVMLHSIEILQIHPLGWVKSVLQFTHLFPGVPIFFFISGFLISKSFESNHKLTEYFQNRVLRLYPGLIICVLLSFVLISVSGYMTAVQATVADWLGLFLAKTTILQFYNPEFMRGYGDGVLNGSLWTITVELQFYILVPIVYIVFKLKGAGGSSLKLMTLIILFLLLNRIYTYLPDVYHDSIGYKLLRVSFLPWFYMFLIGVYVQKNFEFFYNLLAGKFYLVFIVYCFIGYFAKIYHIELGNNVNPIIFVFLAGLAFSFAYSFVGLSKKLLRGNDVSYGTYIYHMPVVNYMLYCGFSGELKYAIYVFIITILLAIGSWVWVEKRGLALKKHPLNPLNAK